MIAYISVSLSKRQSLNEELSAIADTLTGFGIDAFIFVDRYTFDATQEQQMMRQAMADIDKCDILLAETSDKAIGIGIEAGYAKAKGKTVIYIRSENAPHSTTVSGISDFQIVYRHTNDLRTQLLSIIKKIL